MALDLMQMIEVLPQILGIVQIVLYVFLSWFFGSIAVRGFRYSVAFPIKLGLTFVIGFSCMLAGTVLPVVFNVMQSGLVKSFQVDSLVFGVIISIIFAVCLYMMTRDSKAVSHMELSEKLSKRVETMEALMLQGRPKPILESEAREIAKHTLEGYAVKNASMKGAEWLVLLEKGSRKASVLMGAFDGYVKEVNHDMPVSEMIISNPLRIVGIIIIAGILIFSAVNFRGFPTMYDSVASMLGMDSNELQSLMGVGESLPEGCASARNLFMQTGVNIGNMPPYQNEEAKVMFEQQTGQIVLMMFETVYQGSTYVAAVTIPQNIDITKVSQNELLANANLCSATKDKFCNCMKMPSLS